MKVSAAIAVLLSATSGVVAHKCAQGQVYCGSSLINVWAHSAPAADYRPMIIDILAAKNTLILNESVITQTLWNCLKDGKISYLDYCRFGCGGLTEDPDYCYKEKETTPTDPKKLPE
ncbi:DNA-directed RNA polymerase [Pestalotiopsis sp. IQ-011]